VAPPLQLAHRDALLPTTKEQLFKQHERIQPYTLSFAFYLYNKPQYQNPSNAKDLLDDLRNVAIPGTGLPLSLFVKKKMIAWAFVTKSLCYVKMHCS